MLSKQKYSRAAKDQSQLQQFVDEVCEESKRLLPEIKSGDAHKVLKVKGDGSGTEYDFVDISELTAKGECPDAIKALIESLGGTSFKVGYYIYNDEIAKFEWVKEIPEDYSGIAYGFDSDGLYIDSYDNSELTNSIFVRSGGVDVSKGSENASLSKDGVNKLDFASLTHSFDELDPTLKQIVEDAIADNWSNGVSCTQEQWNAIKALLDKSLYLYYYSYTMIKAGTYADNEFVFSSLAKQIGACIDLQYDKQLNVLRAYYEEL